MRRCALMSIYKKGLESLKDSKPFLVFLSFKSNNLY